MNKPLRVQMGVKLIFITFFKKALYCEYTFCSTQVIKLNKIVTHSYDHFLYKPKLTWISMEADRGQRTYYKHAAVSKTMQV